MLCDPHATVTLTERQPARAFLPLCSSKNVNKEGTHLLSGHVRFLISIFSEDKLSESGINPVELNAPRPHKCAFFPSGL